MGLPSLAAALGVAANLEGAAEWRQLWSKAANMAGGARLPGLSGERRDCLCCWCHQNQADDAQRQPRQKVRPDPHIAPRKRARESDAGDSGFIPRTLNADQVR